MLEQFKQIKQRTITQLTRSFPQIQPKPSIKKSSSLQSIYKVIPCPPISPSLFKSSLQALKDKPTVQDVKLMHETLKQTEQYFTACINILEHDQKVRQRYQLALGEEENLREGEMREVKEVMRWAGKVGSKSQLIEFGDSKGHVVMGGWQSLIINNTSPNKSSFSPTKKPPKLSTLPQQQKQLYLPSPPDQYSFITTLHHDQYLIYHQQTLQKFLILLTSTNKLNRQLSTFITLNAQSQQLPENLFAALRSLFGQLAVEELFRVQDNMFRRVVKYLIASVLEMAKELEKSRRQVEYYREEAKDAFVRVFYLQFIARKELVQMKDQLVEIVKNHHSLLQQTTNPNSSEPNKLNSHSTHKQLTSITSFSHKVKQISDFLCDKQQTVFTSFYQRKISKAILCINQVNNVVIVGKKILKKLLEKCESHGIEQRESMKSMKSASSSRVIKQGQTSLNQHNDNNNQTLNQQVDSLISQLTTIQQQCRQFTKSLNKITSQSYQPIFTRIFRRLQLLQTTFSQLKINQSNNSSAIVIKSRLNEQLRNRILKIEHELIQSLRKKSSKDGMKLLEQGLGAVIVTAAKDDDSISVMSRVSSVSSTIFTPHKLVQSDVILQKPTLSNNTNNQMTNFPTLSLDELLNEGKQFIQSDFINNQSLNRQLEDKRNFNFSKLFNLIAQVNQQSEALLKFSIKPISIESPTKIEQAKSTSKNTSPQKGKKGRPSKQKSSSKSPAKLSLTKQSQPPVQSQQTLKRQSLSALKAQLTLIQQLLLPQINQCLISRIFQQTFQTSIFNQVFEIVSNYKQKIFTQKIYNEADKYGLRTFLDERVKFITTITKNLSELKEIFAFVRVFSEQKVRLEVTEQATYELILRALLAQKEISAYRRENNDLAQANKLSIYGVKLLQQEIYLPFLIMFKQLLKITSTDDLMMKELESMLQSVRMGVQIKGKVDSLVGQVTQQTIKVEQIQKKVQEIVDLYSKINRHSVLRFKRLEAIVKTLRSALTLQPKSKTQSKITLIKNYLHSKLQRQPVRLLF